MKTKAEVQNMKTLSELIRDGAKRHPDPTSRLWILPAEDGKTAEAYRKALNSPERYASIGTVYPNPKSPLEFTNL